MHRLKKMMGIKSNNSTVIEINFRIIPSTYLALMMLVTDLNDLCVSLNAYNNTVRFILKRSECLCK